MEIILAWISVALGAGGLVFGIYQNQLKKKVERLAALQAWEVFQSAYQAYGWLSDFAKEQEKDPVKLAQAIARSDSHYTKTIHNLYTHHPKVSPELVEKWIEEGRIKEHSREDFLRQIGEV
jgi:uncharacterized protein HemX